MTWTNGLQGKMKEKGYTIRTLAESVGMSSTCLFNKLHNKSQFLANEIYGISAMLDLSDDDVKRIFFCRKCDY